MKPISKGFKMRKMLRPTIQIIDLLEGLRDFELKKSEIKSCRNSSNLKLFKAKVSYLMILSKEISKICAVLGAVGILFQPS